MIFPPVVTLVESRWRETLTGALSAVDEVFAAHPLIAAESSAAISANRLPRLRLAVTTPSVCCKRRKRVGGQAVRSPAEL
jgi:hypothetical protein